MGVSARGCVHIYRCPWKPEVGIGHPGAGVMGNSLTPVWVFGMELQNQYSLLTAEPAFQSSTSPFSLYSDAGCDPRTYAVLAE